MNQLELSTKKKSEILTKVKKLIEMYDDDQIPKLHEHEVHPELPLGSRENYLYFTLPVCINFQRNSPAMWKSALATYDDPATNYVFFPEKLAKTPIEKIRADLMKHKLALQPNKHIHIWTTIAATFHDYYDDDPREVINEAGSDAKTLIENLHTRNRKKFPYLSGPKLSNYWPYILSQYTDVKFTSSYEISIIPDTHVIQSSSVLGLAPIGSVSSVVEAAWKELLDGTGIPPTRVHPILWNWSRNGFKPEV